MPEQQVEKPVKTNPNAVAPFAIRADHPRSCDLALQAIPGGRLRSTVGPGRGGKKGPDGETRIPIDYSRIAATFPTIPGQELAVNPAKLTYRISDPIEGDEALCRRIKQAMDGEECMFHARFEVGGMPAVQGTLDVHRMKCLVREMLWLVQAGEAVLVKGALPTMEQIEQLPGRFLLNPGAQAPFMQPEFEDQFDDWRASMQRHAG